MELESVSSYLTLCPCLTRFWGPYDRMMGAPIEVRYRVIPGDPFLETVAKVWKEESGPCLQQPLSDSVP